MSINDEDAFGESALDTELREAMIAGRKQHGTPDPPCPVCSGPTRANRYACDDCWRLAGDYPCANTIGELQLSIMEEKLKGKNS